MEDKSKNIDKLCSVCKHDSLCNKMGALFLSDNSVKFNLFTFLDVKNVQLELRTEAKKSTFYEMNTTAISEVTNRGVGRYVAVQFVYNIRHYQRVGIKHVDK